MGTYDSHVYGLLHLLFGDHDALVIAQNRLRGIRLRSRLRYVVRVNAGQQRSRTSLHQSTSAGFSSGTGSGACKSLRFLGQRNIGGLLTASSVTGSGECSLWGSSPTSATLVFSLGAFGAGCACFSPFPEDKIQAT